MRLREFASQGRVLGRVSDEMVTGRDREGLISEINNKPFADWVEEIVEHRRMEMIEFKNQYGISDAALGKKGGSVNSIIFDRKTGLVAEGFNGHRKGTGLPSESTHPLIKDRIDKMRRTVDLNDESTGYQQYDEDGKETRRTRYPHGDDPERHAEVKALNRQLTARVEAGIDIKLNELYMSNRFTLKDDIEAADCPCCANCTVITRGVPAPRAGKNTHPPTHPDYQRIEMDG